MFFGSRPLHRGRPKGALKVLAALMLLLGAAVLTDMQLRPVVQRFSVYQAKAYATKVINEAVYGELAGGGEQYRDLVRISRGEGGEVTSLEADMLAMNTLRGRVTQAVLTELAGMGNQYITVPAGTISGFQMLSGRGPDVQFIVVPAGYLYTQMYSAFESAGLNQTRHSITLELRLSVVSIIPGYTVTTEVVISYPLAETLIVGTVPGAYTRIQLDELPRMYNIGN